MVHCLIGLWSVGGPEQSTTGICCAGGYSDMSTLNDQSLCLSWRRDPEPDGEARAV